MEKQPKYNGLTYKILDDLLSDLMKETTGEKYELPDVEDDGIPWRDQVKEGYLYYIGGDFRALTGYVGAIAFGVALEERGLTNAQVKECIYLAVDDEPITLNQAKWKPIDKE